MDNIIINFTADATGLQPGIAGLAEVTDADKAVEAQAKKTMDAYAKRDKTAVEGNKQNKQSIDSLANSVKTLDKSLAGGIGIKALNDLRNTIKLTDSQWKTFYQNLIKAANKELISATQKEDIEQLTQLVHGAEVALGKLNEKEELVNKTSKSMKAELRSLKQELQELEDQGKENSVEFERLAVRAGKLQDQIGDTDARIRALSSDTFVFDALISGVNGLTGAFAAGQGFVALFGNESEDLQKALLKVNAAMSILQGLQAVQNVLQKQSSASIAIDLLLRRNQTAVTTAQTVATTAQTGATIAATTAQRGLNLAFLATPTGLLLTGIAAVTAALFTFGGASKSIKDETERLNESLQRQNDLLNGLAGDSFAAKISRLRFQIKGATDQQLFDFDVKEEKRKLEEMKTVLQSATTERSNFEEANKKMFDEVREKFGDNVKMSKSHYDELLKQGKIYNEKVGAAIQAVSDQEQKIELMRAERELKIMQDAKDKKVEVAGKTAKEIREELMKKQNEADIAAAKSAQARTEALIIQSKKGSEEELNLKLKALDQGYYAEILVKDRTIGELEKLDAQYYSDRQALINQFAQKEAENAINSRIALAQSAIALGGTPEEMLAAKQRLIDASADLDAQSIRNSEINEELRRLKIKAVYDKALQDKRQLEKDKNAAEIESLLSSALSTIDRERSKNKRANAGDPSSDKAFNDEMAAEEKIISAKRIANFNLLQLKSIDNAEFRRRENDLENQEDELAIKREQRKQERINTIRTFAINTLISLQQALSNIAVNGYQKEQEQIKKLFDQKKISETEYNNQVAQLRRKQAQDEKEMAIFSTLIQQGPVILEGFRKGGFAGVAAAFALFFTMLNAVTSTPVPKFWQGEVDINGPGTSTSDSILARISKGETVTTATQTQKHKPVLQAIHDDKYEQYLMNYELPRLYQNMNVTAAPKYEAQASSQSTGIDYQKMASSLATELANNPQTHLSIDEDGLRLFIQKGNQVTEYKNKKLTT